MTNKRIALVTGAWEESVRLLVAVYLVMALLW